jgi:AraC-like DNA-binding protein
MEEAHTERSLVQTADFETAVESLRRAFGDVDLRRAEDEVSRFAMRSFRLPGIISTRWTFTGVTGGSRDENAEDPLLLTGLVLGGGAHLWSRRGDVDTDRPFLYPETADSKLDRPDFANLGISRSIVDDRARAIVGRDDFHVRFTGTAPVDRAMDGLWRDTMAYTARTIDTLAGLPDSTIAQAGLLDLVASVMLRTFPSTVLDAIDRPEPARAVTPVLRRAVRYIDDHVDQPISVSDIAAAARLSTRGLYAAFRRDMDTTPMEYLRTARTAAAHLDLLRADPGTTTVTEIALRWGFTHAGRFADRHRLTYGESPTDTLRR